MASALLRPAAGPCDIFRIAGVASVLSLAAANPSQVVRRLMNWRGAGVPSSIYIR